VNVVSLIASARETTFIIATELIEKLWFWNFPACVFFFGQGFLGERVKRLEVKKSHVVGSRPYMALQQMN
jgi:hypothetical protein